MKISFDEIAQQFQPWNLTITIGGKDNPVRPISLADKALLVSLQTKTAEEGYKFFESLFEGVEKPAVRDWDEVKAASILKMIMAYGDELVKKNAELAARQTRSAAQASK